jgi:heme/copper-type cytochrome/quinol oxidase subunit 2
MAVRNKQPMKEASNPSRMLVSMLMIVVVVVVLVIMKIIMVIVRRIFGAAPGIEAGICTCHAAPLSVCP